MRCAFDEISAGFCDGQYVIFVDLAFESINAFWDHSFDRLNIVPLISRDECYRVAGICLDIRRLENHCAFCALIKHVDFDIFSHDGGHHH